MNKLIDVCQDIVAYGRERVIGNELQFLILTLAETTMYAASPSEFVSVILTGETGGGKTMVQRSVSSIFPEHNIFSMTSASEKGPIYSEELRFNPDIKFIQFAEYQKLPKSVLEFIKSLSGDDDTFVYEVTIGAERRTERIEHRKFPYNITYAQVEIDPELKSRVMVIPVVENCEINRCVAALKLGVKQLVYNDIEYNTIVDTGMNDRLKSTIASMNQVDLEVEIPFPMALVDMVNHSKSESKRHAGLISALIKASARLNWSNRVINNEGLIIASAQDVANILCMFELLRATTMGADLIDMTMYEKLMKTPRLSEEGLIRFLQNKGLAELTKTEIGRRLGKLYDENYITRENTTTGFLYSSNTHKQELKLKVDWNDIYKYDKSSIVNVITNESFDNICAFGRYIESEYYPDDMNGSTEKIETISFNSNPESNNKISDEEVGLRESIIEYLRSSDGTSNDIMIELHDIGESSEGIYAQDAHGYFEITQLIGQMTDEQILEYNDTTHKYKLNELME